MMETIIIVSLIVLIGLLVFFLLRKKKTSTISTSTTTQITMVPAVANATTNPGYRFIEYVEKYTLIDIDKLEQVTIASEAADRSRATTDPLMGTGRCSTALLSLCFATIEQIGLIVRHDLTAGNVNNELKFGNRRNAISFFIFFAGHALPRISAAEVETIYTLFRNKISHNLFPSHSLGVSQNQANPLNQIVILDTNGNYSINVNFVANYIKQAIPLLKTLLADVTHQAALITQVDNNIRLIEPAEETNLKSFYRANPALQPTFRQWLPRFTF